MPAAGIPLGDILADSGYAHRDAAAWAIPLRSAGAQLVQDLHPHDRGPRGTHHGAIIANGNLYCPATPKPLLELGPLPPGATAEHDRRARPADRRARPAQARPAHRRRRRRLPPRHLPRRGGKIRCPLRPASMTLEPRPARDPHPAGAPARLLHPADHHRPARGRGQDPPETRLPLAAMAALLPAAHRRRARQRHHQGHRHHQHRPRLVPPHGPDPAHPVDRLPARRPQPAHPRRLRTPARHDNARRAAAGLPPRTRKRRRTTLASLAAAP